MQDDADDSVLDALGCLYEDLLEAPEDVEYVVLLVKRRNAAPTLTRRALRPYADRLRALKELLAYETRVEAVKRSPDN